MHNLLTALFIFFAIFGSVFAFLGDTSTAIAVLGGSLPLGVLALVFDEVDRRNTHNQ